jgi:hypothetical protein
MCFEVLTTVRHRFLESHSSKNPLKTALALLDLGVSCPSEDGGGERRGTRGDLRSKF